MLKEDNFILSKRGPNLDIQGLDFHFNLLMPYYLKKGVTKRSYTKAIHKIKKKKWQKKKRIMDRGSWKGNIA